MALSPLGIPFACALASSTMPSASTQRSDEHLPLARRLKDFLDQSTDPFWAVETSSQMLKKAGFEELSDGEGYNAGRLKPGHKYFFTRNKSALVAFVVGSAVGAVSEGGFKVIGAHTDSPNLKVKPRSKRTASGCIQLGVECYGGGLWHTWFDRDLGVSGRVMVRNSDGDTIAQKLIRIDRPLLRISNLAIHLQTADERAAFKVNKEDHLSPILAMEAKAALTGATKSSVSEEEKTKKESKVTAPKDGWTEYQEPLLLDVLADELNVAVENIVDFELNLFDVQKASLGGARSEFIHSARLDNLASCFLAVQALIEHATEENLKNDSDISMVTLFDHEEVGSNSAVGAGSPIMGEAVERISTALGGNSKGSDAIAKSFVLSVDQAHAVHPNYASKHEKVHQPKMNEGMVIKRNSNQRYATNAITGLIIREIAKRAGLPPVQEFVVRNDCGCGSTIGPVISTATGIRAIDMGCPQLSMHSIRETMGVCDLTNGLELFKAFFSKFREVDDAIEQ